MNELVAVRVSRGEDSSHPLEGTLEKNICPLCNGSGVKHFLEAPDRFHLRPAVYRLLRCSSCSCVWLDNPPKPQEMAFHYSDDYHIEISAGGETSPLKRWGWARERIGRYKQNGSLLDIGCNSGSFLGVMKDPKWKLHGIELEPAMAAKAEAATGAEVFVGDALAAPYAANTFDVITSFDLLEHVYQPRQFLQRVHDWLRPGGIYFVALPNIDSWEARAFGTYWYGLELPRHLTHFSPQSLRYVMTALEFRELSLQTYSSYADRSAGYIVDALMTKCGLSPKPAAKAHTPGLIYRGTRKAVRVTLMEPFARLAHRAGTAASLVGIFQKWVPER